MALPIFITKLSITAINVELRIVLKVQDVQYTC